MIIKVDELQYVPGGFTLEMGELAKAATPLFVYIEGGSATCVQKNLF